MSSVWSATPSPFQSNNTMSPGSACQLVVMDRIPFPRPDDPLMSARQKDVEEHGGNGFMAVAATHAALLLAQGAGRLIRAADDRGVVAVLDSRLATARYGSFFRSSMPDFWYTTDRNQVRRSLAAMVTDTVVSPTHRSPSTSCATRNSSVESTPPEKQTSAYA